MTTIVRYLKAGTLSDDLRGGIDPDRTVRVTVEDDDTVSLARLLARDGRKTSREELRAQLERQRERLRQDPSLIEPDPVGRVRALRDEWD